MAGLIDSGTAIAFGLTTTALGTLVPIRRDAGVPECRFGFHILSAGAVGGFLPIVAMAVLLSGKNAAHGTASLVSLGLSRLLVAKPIDYGSKRAGVAAPGLNWHSASYCRSPRVSASTS